MAWKTGRNAPLGLPSVLMVNADTDPKVPVGTIAEFYEDVLGMCELMYLPGFTGIGPGIVVVYTLTASPIVGLVTKGGYTNTSRSIAVALNTIPSGGYGWYQISGYTVVNTVSLSGPNPSPMYASPTSGSVTNTASPGEQILNALIQTVTGNPLPGKSYAMINRSCMQGQIT